MEDADFGIISEMVNWDINKDMELYISLVGKYDALKTSCLSQADEASRTSLPEMDSVISSFIHII